MQPRKTPLTEEEKRAHEYVVRKLTEDHLLDLSGESESVAAYTKAAVGANRTGFHDREGREFVFRVSSEDLAEIEAIRTEASALSLAEPDENRVDQAGALYLRTVRLLYSVTFPADDDAWREQDDPIVRESLSQLPMHVRMQLLGVLHAQRDKLPRKDATSN